MARSRSIGNVYAELSVKDKMTAGIKRAEKSLTQFGSKLTSIGAGFAAALPAAAFAGIAASMKSAIDAGGKLNDMMARTGADGEQLFVLQRAFENAGMSGDAVTRSINVMQKAIAGLNEEGKRTKTRVFGDIGLDVAQLQSMDAVAAFRKIGDALRNVENDAQRLSFAREIFGKSGGDLLSLFNDTQAFETATKQVGTLGKTLSENAARLDAVGESFESIGLKFQTIGAGIAVGVLPALEDMADKIDGMDLSQATSDAILYAKALASIAIKAKEISDKAPGGVALDIAKNAYRWGAEQLSQAGTALPTPDVMINDPLPNYKEGIMLPPAVENAVKEIPELLKRRAVPVAGMTLEETGIPGIASMIDAINASVAPIAEKEAETEDRRSQSWEEVSAEVNSMQSRGLGMGAENVPQKVDQQIKVLERIEAVLKKASADGDMIFA